MVVETEASAARDWVFPTAQSAKARNKIKAFMEKPVLECLLFLHRLCICFHKKFCLEKGTRADHLESHRDI